MKIDEEADKWQKWREKWNSGQRDEQQTQAGGLMTKMVKRQEALKSCSKQKVDPISEVREKET